MTNDSTLPISIPSLSVGDSEFLGYTKPISSIQDAIDLQTSLKSQYPSAAHVAFCWIIIRHHTPPPPNGTDTNDNDGDGAMVVVEEEGFEEDGEPSNSVGPILLRLTKQSLLRKIGDDGNKNGSSSSDSDSDSSESNPSSSRNGLALAIVRHFGHRLLGVSCGRLSQCYASIASLTSHRWLRGEMVPMIRDLSWKNDPYGNDVGVEDEDDGGDGGDGGGGGDNRQGTPTVHSKFGLGAGDCEILIQPDLVDPQFHGVGSSSEEKQPPPPTTTTTTHPKAATTWIQYLSRELRFDGFRGNQHEELPRLQNLQATVRRRRDQPPPPSSSSSHEHYSNNHSIIPVYRYPGNYHGDEWETYHWNDAVLSLKHSVEQTIASLSASLYHPKRIVFNHCVANYYRPNRRDFIGHHSDKDLDLDTNGVIVSLSLGEERILELKRRRRTVGDDGVEKPQDVTRVVLPHGSVLVLGPKTNQMFTHSIMVPNESGERERGGGGGGGNTTVVGVEEHGTNDIQEESIGRISLTFRTVTTFMDLQTGRLYGEGVMDGPTSLSDVRWEERRRDIVVGSVSVLSFAIALVVMDRRAPSSTTKSEKTTLVRLLVRLGSAVGAGWMGTTVFRRLDRIRNRRREERNAREFFSKNSVNGTKYT